MMTMEMKPGTSTSPRAGGLGRVSALPLITDLKHGTQPNPASVSPRVKQGQ